MRYLSCDPDGRWACKDLSVTSEMLKGKDAKKITIEIVDNGSFNPKDVGIIEESKDK